MSFFTELRRWLARGGTFANLTAVNERPLAREIIAVTDADLYDLRLGDGTTHWADLKNLLSQRGAQAFRYVVDTGSTADSDPGAGVVKWNNATQTSATFLYIDDLTARTNTDLSIYLTDLTGADKGYISIVQEDDDRNWQVWKWSTITHGSGYFKFAVTLMASSASFADGKWVRICYQPTGAGGGGSTDETAASIYRKIIAWWERDETSGTVMTDSHINGLHGTYSGLTVNQTGLASNLDKAVTWPSGNNYAEVTHNTLICPAYNFAVLVWAKRNGAQANFAKLLWKPNNTKANGNASYILQHDNFSNGGKVMFRVTGGGNVDALTTAAWADNTATMFVGNKVNMEVQIWRNGSKEGTSSSSAIATIPPSTDALRFGYHGGASDVFVGTQDQCALFKDYLTATEIAYLYNSGAGISYAALRTAAGF